MQRDLKVQTSQDAHDRMRARGFVTVERAAKRAEQAAPTLYRWMDLKLIGRAKVGRRVYVDWASLVAYLPPEIRVALKLDPGKP